MKPRITVITIGADDLEASLRFYRDGLGFPTEGIVGKQFEYGAVVFIQLQPGLRLALWPRKSIGHDTGLAVGPTNSTEMTLGHNVASKAEVDTLMDQARAARSRHCCGCYFSSRSMNHRRTRIHTSSLPTASSMPCSILGLSLPSITTRPSGVCLRSTP